MENKNLKNSKSKKIILVIVLGVVILCLFWNYLLKPELLWHETYFNDRGAFFQAIGKYNYKFGRLPKSLEEMVSTGFLPEKSNMYSCPPLHGTLHGKKLSYTECEYTITFDPNKVVIHVPQRVFDKWEYRKVGAYESLRKWEYLKEWSNNK